MALMKNYAIALGFRGKPYDNIIKAWQILEKNMNIKYVSTLTPEPHIDIITGSTKNIEKIFKILKKIKIKKFKLKSPGVGILANNEPNLYIRWEQSAELLKIVNLINKKTSCFFNKIGKFTNSSLWIPKTTVAYKDFNYSDLNLIFHKVNFLFTKHYAVIHSIYLIDYTKSEIITHKIKIK